MLQETLINEEKLFSVARIFPFHNRASANKCLMPNKQKQPVRFSPDVLSVPDIKQWIFVIETIAQSKGWNASAVLAAKHFYLASDETHT